MGLALTLLAAFWEGLPPAFRLLVPALGELPGRWATGGIGLLLLPLAWGVLRFRHWAWWGVTLLGLLLAWPALSGLLDFIRGRSIGFPLFELAVLACLPYLWARRADFGVGRARPGRVRGP